MSSGVLVHGRDDLSAVAVVPVVQLPTTRLPTDIWHDLIHEMATVRALTAAALAAGDETARMTLLALIETETREVTALLRQIREDHYLAEPADVSVVLADLVGTLAATTEVTLRLAPVRAHRVGIDRVSLRRVLRNLLENAIRAAGPDGVVELAARQTDAGLAISIGDSGPGFGLGPPGLSSRGLVIVRRLIEAVGGSLDVGTSPLGGALVTVTFSLAHLS
ncbi:ATP-binding protein [Kribbella sp. NBC_01245]|uniref:sensor histidine kinase n=1 Tax=Kribbella sp. NBC_01245 TaxID=2903578 RepID=UPI002E2C41B2|nr:ATP-binding protein [Kribbella sp. NBC_01245]